MLRTLHVKNLALIEEAEVDFTEGLNILSGETGAGKSIIIGSMNLALGEKIPKELLRENADMSLVELIFEVTDHDLEKQLNQLDVLLEDQQVILTRKIVNGRGVAKVNSESVPVSRMKEIAALLIDIHGQHEHESLLKKKMHLSILDDFAQGELSELKLQMKDMYRSYQTWKEELQNASLDDVTRMRELSLLEYEVNEIETAALVSDEDDTLETEYRRMSNGRKIMEALNVAYELTASMDGGASDQIGRALRELNAVEKYDEKLHNFAHELSEIDNLLNDFNRELAEFDPETFQSTGQRLDEINHLKSKYGLSIDIILTELAKKQDKIDQLRDFDSYRKSIEEKLEAATKKMDVLCSKISKIRQKYAKELTKQVQDALVDLNFLDVRFSMEFQQLSGYTADGWDDAEFMISTNPGEPLKPLGKVASGGELSRIMLALKAVLAENDAIGTLIFDEIDSGISGRTAQAVSEKMNVIGKKHQVICITHLPQIAAMADTHFLIEKGVVGNNTISSIHQLNNEESIAELARMLGGVKITETVVESAREMKTLAQNAKNS
jgi:DNA repair protein RecN (Recombination protein N)